MGLDRRTLLKSSVALGAMAATGETLATPAASRPPRRIAVEEGFTIPEIAAVSASRVRERAQAEPGEAFIFGVDGRQTLAPSGPPPWARQLSDLGAIRLADMDAAGIAMQLLLLSSPGVQIFSPADARTYATLANDRLAEAVRAHPTRFAGLAAIPPQDPPFAARELERAVQRLGLKGAVINSHTDGRYLDEPEFAPVLEAADALRVPIYVHPRAPSPQTVKPYLDHGLVGAIWGYAVETSLHALRLIFSGAFDRYPRLKIVIGHMGEGIPMFLDRLDTHYAKGGGRGPRSAPLGRAPSEYFKEHFVITTSGMNWEPALRMSLQALGPERVLFAADYPFEDAGRAARRIDAMNLSAAERDAIYHLNAQRVFGIARQDS